MDNHHLPFNEQKTKLLSDFEAYTGKNEIRDDVTVIGFKLD